MPKLKTVDPTIETVETKQEDEEFFDAYTEHLRPQFEQALAEYEAIESEYETTQQAYEQSCKALDEYETFIATDADIAIRTRKHLLGGYPLERFTGMLPEQIETLENLKRQTNGLRGETSKLSSTFKRAQEQYASLYRRVEISKVLLPKISQFDEALNQTRQAYEAVVNAAQELGLELTQNRHYSKLNQATGRWERPPKMPDQQFHILDAQTLGLPNDLKLGQVDNN